MRRLIKGIICPKMHMMSSCIHTGVAQNSYDIISSFQTQSRDFQECSFLLNYDELGLKLSSLKNDAKAFLIHLNSKYIKIVSVLMFCIIDTLVQLSFLFETSSLHVLRDALGNIMCVSILGICIIFDFFVNRWLQHFSRVVLRSVCTPAVIHA